MHTYLQVYLYKVVSIYSIIYILGHKITYDTIYDLFVVSVLFISIYLVSKQIWLLLSQYCVKLYLF